MKRFFAAAAVLALLAGPAFAEDKKPAEAAKVGCCQPKCEVKDGKCVKHEKKECAKDCAQACCKPAKDAKKAS